MILFRLIGMIFFLFFISSCEKHPVEKTNYTLRIGMDESLARDVLSRQFVRADHNVAMVGDLTDFFWTHHSGVFCIETTWADGHLFDLQYCMPNTYDKPLGGKELFVFHELTFTDRGELLTPLSDAEMVKR